jgi:hypothetical protein
MEQETQQNADQGETLCGTHKVLIFDEDVETWRGTPNPSRPMDSRFTSVRRLNRRCALSRERSSTSRSWIKAPHLSRGFG